MSRRARTSPAATRGRRAGDARLDAAKAFDAAADSLDEAVVLLRAGLAPDTVAVLASRATRALIGGTKDDAVGGAAPDARSLVRAVLFVCRESGAPLAAALNRQADIHRALAQGCRDVEVAASGPRATARIVSLLPLAGLAVASLLGFDVVAALTGSVLGGALSVLGVGLSVTGAVWSRRIVESTRPALREPGLLHELTGVALGGGLALNAAVGLARSTADPLQSLLTSDESGASRHRAESPLAEAVQDIESIVAVAHRSGAALRPLLLARADLRRRRALTAARARIERLPAALLAPLGLCSLPAFLLLGVAPALLAVVSSTVR